MERLYIIASQFDLTAKKEEDESYIRTFYDDILMTGKLEQIALNETAKTDAKTPADNTGYYVRPKTIETDDLNLPSIRKRMRWMRSGVQTANVILT